MPYPGALQKSKSLDLSNFPSLTLAPALWAARACITAFPANLHLHKIKLSTDPRSQGHTHQPNAHYQPAWPQMGLRPSQQCRREESKSEALPGNEYSPDSLTPLIPQDCTLEVSPSDKHSHSGLLPWNMPSCQHEATISERL